MRAPQPPWELRRPCRWRAAAVGSVRPLWGASGVTVRSPAPRNKVRDMGGGRGLSVDRSGMVLNVEGLASPSDLPRDRFLGPSQGDDCSYFMENIGTRRRDDDAMTRPWPPWALCAVPGVPAARPVLSLPAGSVRRDGFHLSTSCLDSTRRSP